MDAVILNANLKPMLTVTTAWNTGETGDIYGVKKIPSIKTQKNYFKGTGSDNPKPKPHSSKGLFIN